MKCDFERLEDGRLHCPVCGYTTKKPTAKAVKECGPRAEAKPTATPSGVGTELKKLLRSYGIRGEGGCGCKKHAAKMDAWGIEGCRERREEIIGWLIAAAKDRGWVKRLAAKIASGSLVDEAIRRAEAASQ